MGGPVHATVPKLWRNMLLDEAVEAVDFAVEPPVLGDVADVPFQTGSCGCGMC